MSVRYDGSHIIMWGKDGSDYELWRLDYNGCLRNKKYPNYCLGSGLTLHTEHDILEEQQRWRFNNGYLQTKVNRQDLIPLKAFENLFLGRSRKGVECDLE